jgi:hypothetical protein
MVSAPCTHRSTVTGTKETGREALVVSVGQPAQSGPPGATAPPLTVGTGLAGADPDADADAEAARVAVCVGPTLDGPVPDATAADCVLAHPVASAAAASSGTARAAARLAVRPGRRHRPARSDEIRGSEEARGSNTIRATDENVLMRVPRFCGTPLRRLPGAPGFTQPRVSRASRRPRHGRLARGNATHRQPGRRRVNTVNGT